MKHKTRQVFTLSETEVKQAVSEFLSKKLFKLDGRQGDIPTSEIDLYMEVDDNENKIFTASYQVAQIREV